MITSSHRGGTGNSKTGVTSPRSRHLDENSDSFHLLLSRALRKPFKTPHPILLFFFFHPIFPQSSVLLAVQEDCYLLVCQLSLAVAIDNAQSSSSSAWMTSSPFNTLRVENHVSSPTALG